jgi:periplasmic copper chaperone A
MTDINKAKDTSTMLQLHLSRWARSYAALFIACIAPQAIAHEYQATGFTLIHPWADATEVGQTDAPVYFRLDGVIREDKLIRAASLFADKVELRMGDDPKEAPAAAIPVALGDVQLYTAGRPHLLMRGLKAPLQWGRSYLMMMEFEKAGQMLVMVSVGAH